MSMKHIDKREQRFVTRLKLRDQRLIQEVYPSIEKVKIEYAMTHISVFGKSERSSTLIYAPNRPNVFEIDCINRECTQEYFDLLSEVRNMFALNLSERTGVMRCQGKEAEDHLEQSCDTILDYKITIKYKN